MQAFKNVILGGGMVAGYAAREIAEHGADKAGWAIISADDVLPYERPPLSKGFLAGKDSAESVFINDAGFYRNAGIEVMVETIVETVDARSKRLKLRVGGEIAFEQLLIATGASVRRLQAAGADTPGVYYLRSFDDSKRLRDAATGARHAVVAGAGFIGMEVAAVLAQKGVETTMIFPEERLWQRVFTPEISTFFRRYYEERGVRCMPGTEIAAITGGKHVAEVVLKSGAKLKCDVLVAGIGVTPQTQALEAAGVELNNGVVVNEYLETGVPGVYAAGDVANYYDAIYGKRRRVEHWDNAVEQGKHAARAMLGRREKFEHVPYFFSDVFDLSYEFWGDSAGAERVVFRGEETSASFSAWWLRGGRVLAAFVMRRPDEEREAAQALIRSGARVDASAIADEKRPLPTSGKR
jgi:3-phenylpropionate/trans-cinnamate dioxygenase ferredoxin reductase subunit